MAVAACALGTGTKEVKATAPLLVCLYDRTFVAGSWRAAWRERGGFYGALRATWVLLAARVLSPGGNRGSTVGPGVGAPRRAYPLIHFKSVNRYFQLALWPHPLVFEYGTFWVERPGEVLPFAAVVLPLVAGTGFALGRKPTLGFAGAWCFGIPAPTSLATGTIQRMVEHRTDLPLAAVVAAGVLGAHRRIGRQALAWGAVVTVACGVGTARRKSADRSHLALWSKTLEQHPDNPRARQGLAEA